MDILQMRYILAIAESDSMTQAAERVHVSQSALSLSYRRLEDELGLQLFRKVGRRLELTEAGEYFCAKAAEILKMTNELESSMAQLKSADDIHLLFGSEAGDYTTEAYKLYSILFPEIQVHEFRKNTVDTLGQLHDRTTPFAVTYMDCSDHQLESELLLEEPMYALVSIKSPLANYPVLQMAQLDRQPLITQHGDYTVSRVMRSYFTASGFTPGRSHHVNDPEAISFSVFNGFGFSFVPESVANLWARTPEMKLVGVKCIPIQDPVCTRQLYLTKLRDKPLAPLYQDFADFLRKFGATTQRLRCYPTIEELTQCYWEQKSYEVPLPV